MKEAKLTKSLSVAMQPELYAKVKEITDQRKISMAQWVREIAEAALVKLSRREGVSDE